jgi:hypothetical protein
MIYMLLVFDLLQNGIELALVCIAQMNEDEDEIPKSKNHFPRQNQ